MTTYLHINLEEIVAKARETGADVYKEVAAEMFKVPVGDVTVDQRRSAKMSCYHRWYLPSTPLKDIL